jgi:hypothetical protein
MGSCLVTPELMHLQEICRGTLPSLSSHFHRDRISVGFYPYVGLTHTIRRHGDLWVIRISDHCRQAPGMVLESIATLLACKVLRKKPPVNARRIYAGYCRDPEVQSRVRSRRLLRGRKQIDESRGRHHVLADLYREVNRRYFNDQVEVRKLGWGTRRSWSRLGHYDPDHHTIAISPVLDSPKVPAAVVSYILYHEMLHTLFPSDRTCGPKRYHTAEFKRAEDAFPSAGEVRKFLRRFCRARGR